MRKYYNFFGILTFVVVVVLFVGFSLVGNPVAEKDIKLDETRISDFSNLKYQIENYYQTYKQLPKTLKDSKVGTYASYNYNTLDPETKKEYEYKIVSATSYQLCATFLTNTKTKATGSTSSGVSNIQMLPAIDSSGNPDTTHKKGPDCITYTIPNYYTTPTPPAYSYGLVPTPQVPSIAGKCNIGSDPAVPADTKIMGIYELDNSLFYTINKGQSMTLYFWKNNSDEKLIASVASDSSYLLHQTTSANFFEKGMKYQISYYGNATSNDYILTDIYTFEGNRTVLKDPRCSDATATSTPTIIPSQITP